jgi:hypothetical protein
VKGALASVEALALAARDRVNGPSMGRAACALGRPSRSGEATKGIDERINAIPI